MRIEPGQINPFARRKRRHARPPVMPRHRNAIDDRMLHARHGRRRNLDLARRNILAFPAERIAHAIDEIDIPVRVHLHQVARAEPQIAFHKHVAQQFLLRLRFVIVAIKTLPRFMRDRSHGFARLIRRRLNAETIRPAHRLFRFDVELQDACRQPRAQ